MEQAFSIEFVDNPFGDFLRDAGVTDNLPWELALNVNSADGNVVEAFFQGGRTTLTSLGP